MMLIRSMVVATVLVVGCGAPERMTLDDAHGHDHDYGGSVADWNGEPSEIAITRWTTVRGNVSPFCQEMARSAEIRWMSHVDVTKTCGLGYSVSGCTTFENGAPVVLLADNALPAVAVHEFVHVVEACMTRTMDNSHSDQKLWSGLMYHTR